MEELSLRSHRAGASCPQDRLQFCRCRGGPDSTVSHPFCPLRDKQVHGLMLPLILPSFYSELITLYMLLHEREDGLYSQGIAKLSLFPDTKLLEFLDVQK